MIQVQTLVTVADNSGVILIRCIRLLRGSKKNSATVGNYIVGAIQKVTQYKYKKNKFKKLLKRGEVCKGVVVSINNNISRFKASYIKSTRNAVILVGDNFLPLASRVIGPIFAELRQYKQLRILTLASIIV
jgi:large subunit ribosomal protein L14